MPPSAITAVDRGRDFVSRTAVVPVAAARLFETLAHPRDHHDLDGSGTVGRTITGPDRVALGDVFSTRMKQHGVSYRTSMTIVAFDEGRLIEWKSPGGHSWRWELEPVDETSTRVVETWSVADVNALTKAVYRLLGVPRANARGIESTLRKLRQR